MFLAKADLARPDAELRALASPSDTALVTAHAEIAARELLRRPTASVVRAPRSGTFHDVAIVTFADFGVPSAAVVRLTRRPAWGPDVGLLVESALRPALARAGVGAPDVLALDLSRTLVPTDVQIQSHAPGVCLRDLDHEDAEIGAHFPALARSLTRVGSIPVHGAGPIDPNHTALTGLLQSWPEFVTLRLRDHADACLSAGLIDRAERVHIDRAFGALRAELSRRPLGLLHGDPGSHNIFATESGVTLIDWEDALAGDPLMDLANWATFHPERRWPAFFAALPEAGPLAPSPTERAVFWLYFLRLSLAKTVHRVRFATPDAPGRPPASRRIQRALAALAELGVGTSAPIGGAA